MASVLKSCFVASSELCNCFFNGKVVSSRKCALGYFCGQSAFGFSNTLFLHGTAHLLKPEVLVCHQHPQLPSQQFFKLPQPFTFWLSSQRRRVSNGFSLSFFHGFCLVGFFFDFISFYKRKVPLINCTPIFLFQKNLLSFPTRNPSTKCRGQSC